MKSTLDTEVQHKDNLTLVGISSNGKVTYNIVDNEGLFSETGISIIKRLRKDKNKFIADMYISQSYLSIKYLLDTEIIYSTQEKLQDNTNITDYDKIINLFEVDNMIDNVYIYDLETDVLVISDRISNKFIALDYKDLASIKKFIDENNIKANL